MRRFVFALAVVALPLACTDIGGLSSGGTDTDGGIALGEAGADGGTPLDGGGPSSPCDGPCQPVLVSKEDQTRGIAADSTGVYWTAPTPGQVRRANVDGTNVVTIFDGTAAPHLLALDETNVYFTEYGADRIRSVRKDAVLGNLEGELIVGDAPQEIAVAGGTVFWHETTSMLIRSAPAKLTGVSSDTVGTATNNSPGLAADQDFVYAAVANAVGVVRKYPRGAAVGSPTDLTAKISDLRGLTIDDTFAYVTSGTEGLVKKVALAGGSESALAQSQTQPRGIAVDATHVYWVNFTGEVRRVPKTGGDFETLATGQDGATQIAVNGTAVYWIVQDGRVMLLKKP